MSRAIPKKMRFDVLERDAFTCRYCGAKPEDGALHVDHIIPACEGGTDTLDNLITACEPCNTGKGSRVIAAGAQPLPDMTLLTSEARRVTAEIIDWRAAHFEHESVVSAAAEQVIAEHALSIPRKTAESAIRKYGVQEVDFAAGVTAERIGRERYQEQMAYFHGVLKRRAATGEATANKACPWGWRCPDDIESCIVREQQDDQDSWCACSSLLDQVGGWDAPSAISDLRRISDFINEWRTGAGIPHILTWFSRERRQGAESYNDGWNDALASSSGGE